MTLNLLCSLNDNIAKFPVFVNSGIVDANGGTVTISNDDAGAIFIVAIGGWNYSQLFTVMTANGSTPRKRMLASFYEESTDYPVSANSNWGFIITNTTAYATVYAIYKIVKNI